MKQILYNKIYPKYEARVPGMQMTDIHKRVNMERMRKERLERARAQMKEADVAVMLLISPTSIRYTTAYQTLAYGPGLSYAMVPIEGESIVWGHGACTTQDRRQITWMESDNVRVQIPKAVSSPSLLTHPEALEFVQKEFAKQIKGGLADLGMSNEVLTLDMGDGSALTALSRAGIKTSVRPELMWKAMEIKTQDEIECFRILGSITDIVHYELSKYAEPGKTERELAAYMDFTAMKYGCEPTPHAFVASGQHTWPNYRNMTDKVLRPGDIFFADIIQASWCGYKSCHYRTYSCMTPPSQAAKDAMKRVVDWVFAALSECKPGKTSADMVKHWPDEGEYWGVPPEHAYGDCVYHGLGLQNYGSPYGSRMWSLKYPYELKENMVFAIETQDGIGDGQGVRVEDMVVVTKTGYELLTHFPREIITCPNR